MNLVEAFDIMGRKLGKSLVEISDYKIDAYKVYKKTAKENYNLSDKEAEEWVKEFMTENLTENFTDQVSITLIETGLLAIADKYIRQHKL